MFLWILFYFSAPFNCNTLESNSVHLQIFEVIFYIFHKDANWGRFYKLIYALGQTICALRPTFEKLFTGAKYQGRAQDSLWNWLLIIMAEHAKPSAHGANHRDSSIHLLSAPKPYYYACRKLLKSWYALRHAPNFMKSTPVKFKKLCLSEKFNPYFLPLKILRILTKIPKTFVT